MNSQKPFFRSFFFIFLLTCIFMGAAGVVRSPVQAAPRGLMGATNIVISEFRPSGQAGADDEFIELFNPTGSVIDISNWQVKKSGGCSATTTTLVNIPLATSLQPGQHYLITNANSSYAGIADITYPAATTIASNGGVGITLSDGTTVIDQAGMCDTTGYLEGTELSPLSTNVNRSYERSESCFDENNNVLDFQLLSPSDPQNSNDQPIPCLVIVNVTSQVDDSLPISAPATIDIQVEFSAPVTVTGIPKLSLNTGQDAVYLSPVNSNIVTFRYTVMPNDSTGDLDYISINSLTLNGGTITGAVGNAVLSLPSPGAPGSLGANKNIVIDNGQPPSILSFKRQDPSASRTNADSLTFRVTFSEPVQNVDSADFYVTGTTGTLSVTTISDSIYDLTVSGGDLPNLDATVGLNLSGSQDITDPVGDSLPAGNPSGSNNEVYVVDNTSPTVTIDQAPGQPDPANGPPVNFTVVFSEQISTSTFTVADVTESGTAGFITWSITDSGDHRTFTLSAVTVGQNGSITPAVSANQVLDLAGNGNQASTNTSLALGTVDYNDNVPPSVTINQQSGQADPTTSLPIKFTVVFSEPILASIFTTSDITQNGTATGITWSIVNSGDNKTFTLSATSVTGKGTLIPSIAANRVTDPVGNNNLASTSTDNSVLYTNPPPTPTRTPIPGRISTPVSPPLLVINEFVPRPGRDWNNDGFINTDDEYIEILNHGSVDVNLSGYRLDDEVNIGSSPYSLPKDITLKPGERRVFYGSETGLILGDGGDGVRLIKPNGQLMDAYNYFIVEFSDQSFCRLPDNGGADDWNTNCYPTPGLRNSLSGSILGPSVPNIAVEPLCPIADTLPEEFVLAECDPFGINIWNRYYWDEFGWYDEKPLINVDGKWDYYAE